MLRVGLTGGIGSGKSTAASRLVERGAVLVDSDRLAREVVAPGTPGLAEVAAAFGPSVLDADGALNRPALAAIVFADPAARGRLNGIMHPLVRARSAELVAAAPDDAIVVQDVPLLVEAGMGAHFPLVVVVHADVEERVRRLVGHRGMAESDARARIATQADDAHRKAAADVWLDNSGSPHALSAAVDTLWDERLTPFAANVRAGRTPPWQPVLVDADAEWPAQAARLSTRVAVVAGERGTAAHVGSSAVPGLPAVDVVDVQLGVETAADAVAMDDQLRELGFFACETAAEPSPWIRATAARSYASADPGRPAHLIVAVTGSPGWREVLLLRDWLRADPAARASWLRAKRRAAEESGGDPGRYARAKAAWFDHAFTSADAWAASSGWAPSLGKADPDGPR